MNFQLNNDHYHRTRIENTDNIHTKTKYYTFVQLCDKMSPYMYIFLNNINTKKNGSESKLRHT